MGRWSRAYVGLDDIGNIAFYDTHTETEEWSVMRSV